ncbi:hypothetical protein uvFWCGRAMDCOMC429_024 [Freshwater phage uvFW-CGR-AMD-COM-C429]|nr:hypothetical protein uvFWCGRAMDCOMC429_024 [Freshwater phage uvFW-CGR-AMD-COM-C429]
MKELTDKELIADAMAAADAWRKKKIKEGLHVDANKE